MSERLHAYAKPPAPGRNTASSPGYVSTCTPLLLLVLRANSSRREVLGL